ncbi:LacI family DNA-binding transcriptional regulator [Cryobacterium arcticum]|uniref:LacI family transcriptional regulator n=1 Tax=Cryobacterium arcticum TaxID=670052 RepID=A0A317ZQB0_9MICO|nr:substrate-binding domain-containing protein [Cryobacterium arcticum]PXA68058.1 LacI family transcriptional regulator [Cryobacterium arcticum]
MRIPRRVTLSDIATAAGVSKATASKVLNHRGGTSDETRLRVESVMRELGYVAITRERAPADNRTVTAVFDNLVALYSLCVLGGLVDGAQALDVDLVTNVTDSKQGTDIVLNRAWVRRLAAKGHSGLIVVTTSIDAALVSACAQYGVPLVAVDAPNLVDASVVSIGSNHWSGGMDATRHLLELGHRRIGFLGGDAAIPGLRERLAGYREALAAAGVDYDPELVSETGMATAAAAVPGMLELADPPTAFFVTNDGDAMAVVRAVHQSGRRVPEDVSVVGYDDTYSIVASVTHLTTVHTPMHEIGKLALETVIGMAEGRRPISSRLQLATHLVPRESSIARA